MKRFSYILIILGLWACKSDKKQNIVPISIEFEKEGELLFLNEKDTLVAVDIELAETDYEQQTGLMHRNDMKMTQAMLFIYQDERPRPNFYMKNTKMALDLIYISADKTIVEINRNAQAYDETPIPAQQPAQYVLEVKAGFVEQYNISDSLTMDYKIIKQ